MMMMTTRPVEPPPESDEEACCGAGGATTGVKEGDGEAATGAREVEGEPATVAEAEKVGELDVVAVALAVFDADEPFESVAVGEVEIARNEADLDGDAPRLSDAVAVGVAVALLERDDVVEMLGDTDADAPRDRVAVTEKVCVEVNVVVCENDREDVDDGDAPRLSVLVAVGEAVALLDAVGVRVAFCVRVDDGAVGHTPGPGICAKI
jgi:hypothetical protein